MPIDALATILTKHADEWRQQLRQGFSLFLFGAGSKRSLLEAFAAKLDDGPVLILHGFIPEVHMGQVLSEMVSLLQESATRRGRWKPKQVRIKSRGDTTRMTQREKKRLWEELEKHFVESTGRLVYMVVHSIDSPPLRFAEWRKSLERIAACPRVRVVASSDNVLGPAMFSTEAWNHHFNFWPHHVTTGEPFSVEEKAAQPQIRLSKSAASSAAATAEVVLKSLTKNARSVFLVVCEYQLEQVQEQKRARDQEKERRADRPPLEEDNHEQTTEKEIGLSAQELYRRCRLKFLVTNETALNAHLREFKDHGLLRSKRKADGAEVLVVGLHQDSLEQLLEILASWQE